MREEMPVLHGDSGATFEGDYSISRSARRMKFISDNRRALAGRTSICRQFPQIECLA